MATRLSWEEYLGLTSHVDHCIQEYLSVCRKRIPTFVEQHFSLKQTWELQRQTLWFDCIATPLNTLYAIPALSIKKVSEICRSLGFLPISDVLNLLPSSIKTGYQREIENAFYEEILGWDFRRNAVGLPEGLYQQISLDPKLGALLKGPVLLRRLHVQAKAIRNDVNQYISSRALVSDLASGFISFGFAHFTFGNGELSLKAMAMRFAHQKAHDRAASHFFLGKRIGGWFYDIFPPDVDEFEVRKNIAFLFAGFAVAAMLVSFFSDPLRKFLGMHQRRLQILMDEVEKELLKYGQGLKKQLLACVEKSDSWKAKFESTSALNP